ncbi:hypothetical protein Vi05172_g8512 [Venturia inaequalis]|nr:hypothetical protein Vi05172_g8512 [Venturia inaequalis]
MASAMKQKRKFSHVEREIGSSSDSASKSSSQPSPSKKRKPAPSRTPSLTPQTSVDGDEPPRYSEKNALEQLLWLHTRLNDHKQTTDLPGTDEYISIELTEFTIYQVQQSSSHADLNDELDEPEGEVDELSMVPLHFLKTKRACKELVLNGTVTHADASFHLRAVTFDILSIEGYGDDDCHSVSQSIWIQTAHGKTKNIWYRLATPSAEYFRFHSDFLWIADFGKHFIDFLEANSHAHLSDFRSNFHDWIKDQHSQSKDFRAWFQEFGKVDFRTTVAAHIEYLWKEAGVVFPVQQLSHHWIWAEADSKAFQQKKAKNKKRKNTPTQRRRLAIHRQEDLLTNAKSTIVSPFVYDCFHSMYFGGMLEVRDIKQPVILAKQALRRQKLGFARNPSSASSVSPMMLPPYDINTGDVVVLPRDEDSVWKSDTNFAFVQKVCQDNEGSKYLKLIWLYRSSETTCANMRYPYPNELFISDHCECDNTPYRVSEVLGKVLVLWNPPEIPNDTHFVRQKYQWDDQSFIKFTITDYACGCEKQDPTAFERIVQQFKINDTILVLQGDRLEPVVVVAFDKDNEKCQVRLLLRMEEVEPDLNCPANELCWTRTILTIQPDTVVRKCQIIFLRKSDKIPILYDRQGQVDLFFITKSLEPSNVGQVAKDLCKPFRMDMNIGIDFTTRLERPPLNALSLFSGGGNFDRGLEEGLAVHSKWAVEWDAEAAHTYRANCKDKDQTFIFLGSVDEALARTMEGKYAERLPQVDEVDMISGGSPCPGFSLMQRDPNSDKAKLDASKIASLASWVDVHRPAYVVLENVVAMGRGLGVDKKERVFSQFVCALVGMGYQLQQFLIDAWSTGDPQTRSRLFVVATAPNLVPMRHPHLTHSHPEGTLKKSIGTTENGLPFGNRRDDFTPFEFVSAAQATKDLPNIVDGQTHVCIPFPDHRQSIKWNNAPLTRLSLAIVDFFNNQNDTRKDAKSKSWTRPGCAHSGAGLHWEQPRTLTILEARRAQGFPDYEPIVGSAAAQWRIVGNSVASVVKRPTVPLNVELLTAAELVSHEEARSEPRVEGSAALTPVSLSRRSRFVVPESDSEDDDQESADPVFNRDSTPPGSTHASKQFGESEDAHRDLARQDHRVAGLDPSIDVSLPPSTAVLLSQTRTSPLDVRTRPIVVIPRKTARYVDPMNPNKGSSPTIFTQMAPKRQEGMKKQHNPLSSSKDLAKGEPKKRKGWKGWVEIDEDETPRDHGGIGIGPKADNISRRRTARHTTYSIDEVTIEDSDSDDGDDGPKNILPRTTSSISLLQPAAPRRSGRAKDLTNESPLLIPISQPSASWRPLAITSRQRAAAQSDQQAIRGKGGIIFTSMPLHTSRNRGSRYVVPESESGNEGDDQGQVNTGNAYNIANSIRDSPPLRNINTFGESQRQSIISPRKTQHPPAINNTVPEFEMFQATSQDTSSEASEEPESMFVPFRMFASQTPNLIVLDSSDEGEDASVVEGDQPQRMEVATFPARIYIDLDELDD